MRHQALSRRAVPPGVAHVQIEWLERAEAHEHQSGRVAVGAARAHGESWRHVPAELRQVPDGTNIPKGPTQTAHRGVDLASAQPVGQKLPPGDHAVLSECEVVNPATKSVHDAL